MTYVREAMDGENIRAKYNPSSSVTIAAHVAVKLDSTEDHIALPGGDTDHLFGVTLEAVPPLSWGPIQIRGKAKVLSGGALSTPGVLLKATTAGKAAAWSASADDNAHVLGTLETTAGGADELVEVELVGPGVINQG